MAKEYIDREALIKRLDASPLLSQMQASCFLKEGVLDIIRKFPAADVVEVVRCKDCKHFAKGMAVGMCKRIKDRPIIPTTYNHYCSYGERKERG